MFIYTYGESVCTAFIGVILMKEYCNLEKNKILRFPKNFELDYKNKTRLNKDSE